MRGKKLNGKLLRPRSGATLVEGTTALMWFVPLTMLVLFVVMETTKAYQISRDLQIGAGLAARALATSGSTTTPEQQAAILQNVTVGKSVVDPSQFYEVQWHRNNVPPTVSVAVQYKSTGFKQPPPFPDPDPLQLSAQFILKEQASYRLLH